MKKYLSIACIVLLAACNSGSNKKGADAEDTTGSENIAYDITPVWTYEYDSVSGDSHLKKLRELTNEERSAGTLIAIASGGEVQLKLIRVSGDTMYVTIPDSKVLTQQMGSTGATQFMATATYTLTEMSGVKYIHFDFQEGDHAEPGTYSRENFNKGF